MLITDEVRYSIEQIINIVDAETVDCKQIKQVSQTKKDLHQKGRVIFVFDDNWSTQYTVAYPILAAKGFPATIAVIPSKVGDQEYMSLEQLKDVYQNGWDLINHTYHHRKLSQLDYEEQKDEMIQAKQWLDKHCFTKASNIVAYPYGDFNQVSVEVLQDEAFRSARTVKEGFEGEDPNSLYQVTVKHLSTVTEVKEVKSWINEVIRHKSTVLLLNHRFENLENDSEMMGYDPKKFQVIVEYLDQRRKDVEVITYLEWLDQ